MDRNLVTSITSVAAVAALIYYTVTYVSDRNKKINGCKEIPVPGSSYPYIGHLFSLGENPNDTFKKWHKEFGSVIKIKMGAQTWVSINDPYIAQKVFSQNGMFSSQRPLTNFGFHYSYNESGIIFGNGEKWKSCRGALLSVLAPKMVDKYMKKIEFESLDLVERLLKTTEEDGSVDPAADLQLNALNVISHVTIGKRYVSKEDPEFKAVCEMIKKMVKLCAFDMDLPRFLPILSFMSYVSNVEKMFKDYVQNERDPILSKLIEEATVSSDINIMKALDSDVMNITPTEKMVILSDVIIAGEDTTEMVLYWAIGILCHYPDVQKKIQTEIDEFIKKHDERPIFAKRDQLPYMISVMKECMRYRPISYFGLPHETIKDIALDEYVIPKGTIILTPMRALHRNPTFYKNPEEFIPERFLNNTRTMYAAANGRVDNRDHFVFGWGRRLCPGIYLAEAELFNGYVSLFSKCTIEPVTDSFNNPIYPDIESIRNAGIVVAPVHYRVKIVKRS